MNDKNQTNIISFTLTPKLEASIYEEVKKAFLRKDGKPFKREKRYWIKNLIKRVAESSKLGKDIIKIGIKKLINYGLLIEDYKNEIYYYPEFEKSMKTLNGIDW